MPKPSSPLSGIFSPGSPIEFLGFAIVSGMMGLMSSGNPIGFAFVPLLAIGWWWFDRYRQGKLAQRLEYAVSKQPPTPAKGLILLVSPFSPRDRTLQPTEILNPLIEQILMAAEPSPAAFEAIAITNSNLYPQIKAIEYHMEAKTLREVWLITTESYDQVKGSETAAALLEKYLRLQYGRERLDIHRQGLTVREYDYRGLWELVEQIFRESGYRQEALVADITGGTKMMSVAIAMACIPPGRKMQYMDAQRDWQGNTTGQGLSPIVIDVDPILHQ